MNALPANINAATARLPKTYEAAKTALSQCASLDECQSWADKAAALASYARQASDPQLEKMALRIRGRAVERSGELLKQLDARGGDRSKKADARPSASPAQKEAARAAGMSPHQTKQAVRVANVPKESREAQIEGNDPPTITALANQGIKPRPKPLVDLKGRDPKEFNQAMHYIGPIRGYARELTDMEHDKIIPILTDEERDELRECIGRIDAIHDKIVTRI